MKAIRTFRSASGRKFMPVRIYDISKKLGLENKEILAKAKAMGIAAAKVPSSSLDKITAEYLEEELLKDHPEVAARLAAQARRRNRPSPRRSRKKSSSSPRRRRNRRNRKSSPNRRSSKAATATAPHRWLKRRNRRATAAAAAAQTGRPEGGRQSRVHSIADRVRSRAPAKRPERPNRRRRARARPQQTGFADAAISALAATAARSRRPRANRPRPPPRRQPKFVAPDDRRGHRHQAADRRARTGRAAQAEAVQDHRRFDGAGRLRQRQPGD